jgi:hypothetical protein
MSYLLPAFQVWLLTVSRDFIVATVGVKLADKP